jgi:hypothetical protein
MAFLDLSGTECSILQEALETMVERLEPRLGAGVPAVDQLLSRIKEACSDEPADPNTPAWQRGSGECPLLVVRGTISDGYQFYGPFDNESQVRAFADRLGFNVDSYEVKILDIPTH